MELGNPTAMRMRRVQKGAIMLGVIGALFVACDVGETPIENKGCPCGVGFVCDAARNVCVVAAVVIPEAGAGVDAAPPCTGDACPCETDNDCKDPLRKRCSAAKICVECLPASDNCLAGSYCNDATQCIPGCKQESDCQISPASPHCD